MKRGGDAISALIFTNEYIAAEQILAEAFYVLLHRAAVTDNTMPQTKLAIACQRANKLYVVGQFPLLARALPTLLNPKPAHFQLRALQREHQISWFPMRAVPKSLANVVRWCDALPQHWFVELVHCCVGRSLLARDISLVVAPPWQGGQRRSTWPCPWMRFRHTSGIGSCARLVSC